ncbi:MAG: hypothetical protein ACR2P0_04475 [Acidimicrobiales bacterium]
MTSLDRPSVRVEIDGEMPEIDIEAIEVEQNPDPSRWQPAALVALIAAVVLGLWLSAGTERSDDATPETTIRPTPTSATAESVDAGDARLEGDGVWTPITLVGDQLVELDGVWIGLATPVADDGQAFQQAIVSTSDGITWHSEPASGLPAAGPMIGLAVDELGLIAAHATIDGPENTLSLYRSTDGTEWIETSAMALEGHPRRASIRDGRWVVVLDRLALGGRTVPQMGTRLVTGLVDDGEPELALELAPNEFAGSYTATSSGLLITIVQVNLTSSEVGDDSSTTRVAQWTRDHGLTTVSGIEATNSRARFIASNDRGVFFFDEAGLFHQRSDSWVRLELAGPPVPTGARRRVSPALSGPGFLVVDERATGSMDLWVTKDGEEFVRFTPDPSPRRPVLALVTDAGGIIAAEDQFRSRSLTRVALDEPSPFDIEADRMQLEVVDGEWSEPVRSVSVDGRAFVALANSNGLIELQRSRDGFAIDESSITDLPFGYFPQELLRVDDGYVTHGRLGLLENAVFHSADGVGWTPIEIELPHAATRIEIALVDRRAQTNLIVGTLGWADEPERSESALMWWPDGGAPVDVPSRPCATDFGSCRITSAAVTPNGVVATYTVRGQSAFSTWSSSAGWLLPTTEIDGQLILQSTPIGPWMLGEGGAIFVTSGARPVDSARFLPGPPASGAEDGAFIAIADDGRGGVYQTADAIWTNNGATWFKWPIPDGVRITGVEAVHSGLVLLSGFGDGRELIRLAMPTV